MDLVNIFKDGFKTGEISYEKKDDKYVICLLYTSDAADE